MSIFINVILLLIFSLDGYNNFINKLLEESVVQQKLQMECSYNNIIGANSLQQGYHSV